MLQAPPKKLKLVQLHLTFFRVLILSKNTTVQNRHHVDQIYL